MKLEYVGMQWVRVVLVSILFNMSGDWTNKYIMLPGEEVL